MLAIEPTSVDYQYVKTNETIVWYMYLVKVIVDTTPVDALGE